MPAVVQVPDNIRPYQFHGLKLKAGTKGQWDGDCPFCGNEGRFTVHAETTKWRCWKCDLKGNLYGFLKEFHTLCLSQTTEQDYEWLRANRKLLNASTPKTWQAAKSVTTGQWLVPGWSIDGKEVQQLYRWSKDHKSGKLALYATPTIPQRVYGANLLDPKQPGVFLTEGAWDAMALWEASELDGVMVNVIAVPGCLNFNEQWCEIFRNKNVSIMFDSDHPGKNSVTGEELEPVGFRGVKKTAQMLRPYASEIKYLNWGEKGFDPTLRSGTDIRDILSGGSIFESRTSLLDGLLAKVVLVPGDIAGAALNGEAGKDKRVIHPLPCSNYVDLIGACSEALKWRQDLDDVFSVMLAVCLSTSQTGDQLMCYVIGDAGSSKTRMAEALLVSKKCRTIEHLTGFHSGWKGENGEDCSLLNDINHTTLITCEGDVLATNPKFTELMSQARRIFDGSSTARYKNSKEDMAFLGLRTPWIICGTPALLDHNQARVGDRFLKVFIEKPTETQKHSILNHVALASLRQVRQTSNGDGSTTLDPIMLQMYRLAGGYVDHLRKHAQTLLENVQLDVAAVAAKCIELGEFAAYMRAMPSKLDTRAITHNETKELPTRLTSQFVRLAVCLAAVLNRDVDDEVLRRVKKVAIDTAHGPVLEIAKSLASENNQGCYATQIALRNNHTRDVSLKLLRFIRSIGAAEAYKVTGSSQVLWKLTDKVFNLFQAVMGTAVKKEGK